MKKRIASLVLAALMVLVSVPVFSLTASAADTAYTYTTSWQKNMPQAKYVDGATAWSTAERVDVSNAWNVGWYPLDSTAFTAYNACRYTDGAAGVEFTTLNVSYGSFYSPRYAQDYMMMTRTDVHNGFHYVAEYDGLVDISIDSLYYVGYLKSGSTLDAVHHSFAILHNGSVIWPANADYTDVSTWWMPADTATAKVDVSGEITVPSVTLKKGDSIDFVFAYAGDATPSYEEQRSIYNFDASIKYTNPEFSALEGYTKYTYPDTVIPGTPTVPGVPATPATYATTATVINSSATDTTIGAAPETFYANLEAYQAANPNATADDFKAYLMNYGKVTWENTEWSMGAADPAGAVGNFARFDYFDYLLGLSASSAAWNSSQKYSVTAAEFEKHVDAWVSGTKLDPDAGTIVPAYYRFNLGAMNNASYMANFIPNTGYTVFQYTATGDAKVTFAFTDKSWNWKDGDSMCIVVDGAVIWPTNATWSDTTNWYGMGTSVDMATVNAALANVSAVVTNGSTVQFCFARNNTGTNARRAKIAVSVYAQTAPAVEGTPEIPGTPDTVIPGKTVYYKTTGSAAAVTGPALPTAPTNGLPAHLNETSFKADAAAVAQYGTYKNYLLAYGKYTYSGDWKIGTADTDKAAGNFVANDRSAYIFNQNVSMSTTTAWKTNWWGCKEYLITEDAFEKLVDKYISGATLTYADIESSVQGTAGVAYQAAMPEGVYVQQYTSTKDGLATFNITSSGWEAAFVNGSAFCLVVDGNVVFPTNADWTDTTTWFALNYSSSNTTPLTTDLIPAFNDKISVLVNVGSTVQFCFARPNGVKSNGSNGIYPMRVTCGVKIANADITNNENYVIEDTSVSIGDSMALNYYVRASVADGTKVGVVIDGEFYEGTLQSDGTYKVAAPGVPAKDIAKDITAYAAVKNGDAVTTGDAYTTSIALRLAQYTTLSYGTKVNALATAALAYATAAQTYFEVTDTAANIYLPAAKREVAATGTYTDGLTLTQGTTVSATGMNVALMDNVSFLLDIKVDANASYTATISDGNNVGTGELRKTGNGKYRVVFADIAPTAWGTDFTITVTNNADASDVMTLTYSVATYAARTASNADVKAVTDTMMALYEAAAAYSAVVPADTTASDNV